MNNQTINQMNRTGVGIVIDKVTNTMTITLPMKRELSKTRASYVIATSGLFKKTGILFEGQEVKLSATAIIDNKYYGGEIVELAKQANYLSGREKK